MLCGREDPCHALPSDDSVRAYLYDTTELTTRWLKRLTNPGKWTPTREDCVSLFRVLCTITEVAIYVDDGSMLTWVYRGFPFAPVTTNDHLWCQPKVNPTGAKIF